MLTKACQSIASRNSTTSSTSGNLSYADWIPNSFSSLIFLLALIGNTAALIVMFGWRGPIRLTNNKYLANLACADLLRACFMPFTIVARMKKNFLFGKMICKILPIVQGLSVGVDIFTLVCISIERYLAICRPLSILKLQSLRHTNLLNSCILIFIWLLGLIIALPNFYLYNLCSLPKAPGRYKCEKGAEEYFEKSYMIALDLFYFVIPFMVMVVLYTAIIWKMCRNNTAKRMRAFQNNDSNKTRSYSSSSGLIFSKKSPSHSIEIKSHPSSRSGHADDEHDNHHRTRSTSHCHVFQKTSLASSQSLSRIDRQRRKALKLLIVLIVEFFLCWTPLFMYHTIGTFEKHFYRTTSKIYVDLILLFSFASASCNPLTYYFMSKRYRAVLYAYLPCNSCRKSEQSFRMKQRAILQLKSRRTN